MNEKTENNDEIVFSLNPNAESLKGLSQEEIEKLESIVSIRRRNIKDIIRLCPICVFQAVKIIPSYANFLIPSRYFCPKCNWQGAVALEASISDLEQFIIENPHLISTDEETQEP